MFEVDEEVSHGLGPAVPADALVHLEGVDKVLGDLELLSVYQKGNTKLLRIRYILGLQNVL